MGGLREPARGRSAGSRALRDVERSASRETITRGRSRSSERLRRRRSGRDSNDEDDKRKRRREDSAGDSGSQERDRGRHARGRRHQSPATSPPHSKPRTRLLPERPPVGEQQQQSQQLQQPTPPQVARHLLDSISDKTLEHAKQLGLFDELRVKLLEEVQALAQFQSIGASFRREVGDFCQAEGARLGEPRAKLREHFSDQCERGRFKSLGRLDEAIERAIASHQDDLVQHYCGQLADCPPLVALAQRAQRAAAATAAEPKADPLEPAPATKPNDHNHDQERRGVQRDAKSKELRTASKTPGASNPPLANIPTPSPSVSPPQTPPTPIKRQQQQQQQVAAEREGGRRSPARDWRRPRESSPPPARFLDDNNFRRARKQKKQGGRKRKKKLRQRLKRARLLELEFGRAPAVDGANKTAASTSTPSSASPAFSAGARPEEAKRGERRRSPAAIKRLLPVARTDCKNAAVAAAAARQPALAAPSAGLAVK